MRFFLVLLAILCLHTPSVWPWSCGPETDATQRFNIDTATIIFTGQAIEVAPPPYLGENLPHEIFQRNLAPSNPNLQKITFQVHSIHKGAKSARQITAYFDPDFTSEDFEEKINHMIENHKSGIVQEDVFLLYDFSRGYNGGGFCYSDHAVTASLNFGYNKSQTYYYVPSSLCLRISEEYKKKLKDEKYEFSKRPGTLERCSKKTAEKYNFLSLEELKLWVEQKRPQSETKTISFKGEEIIAFFAYDPPHRNASYAKRKQKLILSLYHKRQDKSYIRIGFYNGYANDEQISVKGDLLQVKIDEGGEKLNQIDYAVSDLLGQSCLKDEHCLDGHYCLKNDYFKPRGLCSPCAETDPADRPATCR